MSLTGENGTQLTMPVMPAGSMGNCGMGGFGCDGWWGILFLIAIMCGGWGGFGGFGGMGGLMGLWPLLFGGFGNGFGGGMNGGVGSEVQRGFDHSSVVAKLDGITQGLCDGFYAQNTALMNGFHGVDNAICNLGYNIQQGFNTTNVAMMQGQNAIQTQLANCCCEAREAIQGVNYNLATQSCDTRNVIQNSTRDIIESNNSGFRAILDKMCQQELAAKDAQIAAQNQRIMGLELSASQANQNATLMAAMDANKAELLRRTGHDCPTAAYVVQPPTPVNFPTNCCGQFNGGWGNNCGGCG